MNHHPRRRILIGLPALLVAPAILTGCGGDSDVGFEGEDSFGSAGDPTVTRGSTSKPVIALTFDDGPHPTLTPKLLDILAEKKVKATFYVLGQRVAQYPALAKRIRREGHELGNHSWSHANLASRSDSVMLDELKRTGDVIRKATGKRPTTMRPPYGALTERQRRLVFKKLRLPTIMWTVDSLDYTRTSSASITQRIKRRTGNGAIILGHDIHERTIRAMPATIDALKAKGFRFVTVSKLIR